jgi:hypothetical protein
MDNLIKNIYFITDLYGFFVNVNIFLLRAFVTLWRNVFYKGNGAPQLIFCK